MSKEEENKQRSKFRSYGCGNDKPLKSFTVQCDFFAEFMRRRFPNADENYADDWARRFANGDQFQHADRESRRVLLDIMIEGPGDGTARHLDEEDLAYLHKK